MKTFLSGRKALLYFLAGAVFSAELFLVILTHRSIALTGRQVETLRGSGYRAEAIKESMEKMKDIPKGADLPEEGSRDLAEALLLDAVDRVRARLHATGIKVSDFEESEGTLSLGIEVEAPMRDYKDFAEDMNYLESMIRPWFRVKDLVIRASEESYTYRFSGKAMMPTFGGPGGGSG